MAETSFEVKYEGDALRDGRMPVRDLAPALLSLGELMKEASLLLFPDNDPVALEIEATKEGSFAVDLIMQAASENWEQIVAGATGGGMATSLSLLKDWVIGDDNDVSLFGLLKKLKGKRVEKEAPGPGPGETTLTAEDIRLVVRSEIAVLNRDKGVRRRVREVVEPLHREGIDVLKFRSDNKPVVEIEKGDAPAFELPATDDSEILSEQEIDVYLEVLTAELEKGSARKWRFGGIGETFQATVDDSAFLEKVNLREEVFGTGDQLHSRLQIIQRRDPATGRIRADRRVVKVYDYIEAPEQLAFEGRVEESQESPESDAEAG